MDKIKRFFIFLFSNIAGYVLLSYLFGGFNILVCMTAFYLQYITIAYACDEIKHALK